MHARLYYHTKTTNASLFLPDNRVLCKFFVNRCAERCCLFKQYVLICFRQAGPVMYLPFFALRRGGYALLTAAAPARDIVLLFRRPRSGEGSVDNMVFDVIIVGSGPGGIFTAYELTKLAPGLKVAVFEAGNPLHKRKCPIDGDKIKSCIRCSTCAIMNGFGGAGAFSDGKYNITNHFGGTLYEYVGRQQALDLMMYVDGINLSHGGSGSKLYSTANTHLKKECLEHKLHLLDAQVRHLGTDVNYVVLENLYNELKDKLDFHFNSPVSAVTALPLLHETIRTAEKSSKVTFFSILVALSSEPIVIQRKDSSKKDCRKDGNFTKKAK